MKTTSAGPDGVLLANHEYDLDAAEGKALCEGGYAVPVREQAIERATVAPDEKADRRPRKGAK